MVCLQFICKISFVNQEEELEELIFIVIISMCFVLRPQRFDKYGKKSESERLSVFYIVVLLCENVSDFRKKRILP